MTSSKKAWLSVIAVFAIVFSLYFVASAFKSENSTTKEAEQIWFSANPGDHTNLTDLSNYDIMNGTKSLDPVQNCSGSTYACSIGFSESDCSEISPGVYKLNASPASTPEVRPRE